MQGDRQQWVKESGEDIEALMAANHKQEARNRILRWYIWLIWGQASPLCEHLDHIATERAELYRCRPPEGLRLPILVTPAALDKIIPEEAEIEKLVRGLKRGRADGPSGMGAEDIKWWLQEALQEKNLVRRQFQLLVRLIQRMFEDGVVPE